MDSSSAAARIVAWLVTLALASPLVAGAAALQPAPQPFAVFFETDPLADPAVRLEGSVFDRLAWNADPERFPGDRPGSLTALYDANLDPGRIGWSLPAPWTQDDPFVAAAAFVIDSDGFSAPGLFQISWGLWSSRATGFNRTGNPENLAGDTFELIEWDYFPGEIFGGPFYSPALFGVANPESPAFPSLGSFANATFAFLTARLPLDEPLLAVIEHRPSDDAAVFSVFRITASGLLPVSGAVAVVPLQFLSKRQYALDTFGLTLWQDGFRGPVPALRARVHFHALGVREGLLELRGGFSDALGLAR
jgi:hypothetical protein